MRTNDISLAQWALVEEVKEGKWKTPDFPKIAREDFGINGIEFVNTLFEVPTISYQNTLKQNARLAQASACATHKIELSPSYP